MKKRWHRPVLFLLPVILLICLVNWHVDSYALLRITYDEIAAQMAEGFHVEGLEESQFNDRKLLLARLRQMEEPCQVMVFGSSRVFTFDRGMFVQRLTENSSGDAQILDANPAIERSPTEIEQGASRARAEDPSVESSSVFYNAGLSEATIYDLLAVAGILDLHGKLPKTAVIGVDAFLFNSAHDNEKWRELESYVNYMTLALKGERPEHVPLPKENTGREPAKALSLDYFRYNVTLLPEKKRFLVSYTKKQETEGYLKRSDGSVAYERPLREVSASAVEELTRQSMAEHVVYRLTDFSAIDEAHFARFSALVSYLREAGVEVILYLPPYSPMMYNYIESETDFRIALEVEERVKALAKKTGAALYGSYDPAGCGLQMSDLYDVYHVKAEKTADTFYPVIPAQQK